MCNKSLEPSPRTVNVAELAEGNIMALVHFIHWTFIKIQFEESSRYNAQVGIQ